MAIRHSIRRVKFSEELLAINKLTAISLRDRIEQLSFFGR